MEFEEIDIDLERTRKDHMEDGCRIYDKEGYYYKLYEYYFMMSFTSFETDQIFGFMENDHVTVKDVVDYYYRTNK